MRRSSVSRSLELSEKPSTTHLQEKIPSSLLQQPIIYSEQEKHVRRFVAKRNHLNLLPLVVFGKAVFQGTDSDIVESVAGVKGVLALLASVAAV